MCDISNLTELPVGERAQVVSVLSKGRIRRRLLDLGLTPQAEVECVSTSPSGDPRAYLIRGAVIAIRNTDGRNILINRSSSEVTKWD